jgi:uncharacterized membrane protein HdeD (DUF308 family)
VIVVGAGPWQPMVLSGVLALVFGAIVLIWPASAIEAFVILFGIFVLIDGAAGVAAALRARALAMPWVGSLAMGVAGIVAGAVALAWPGATLLLVIYVAAIWAIVKGVFALAMAAQRREQWPGDRTASFGGWAWLVFGALMFLWPIIGVVALAWLIGIVAVIFGAVLVALGLHVRQRLGGGA